MSFLSILHVFGGIQLNEEESNLNSEVSMLFS